MTTPIAVRDVDYILGSQPSEQNRLRAQGDELGPLTERLLAQTGIGAGMRVLDVGCGIGDVTLLLARRVGDTGEVVGIDRDPHHLATASARAHALGLKQLRFIEGDFRALAAREHGFDAAFGRLVLMYQPNAAEAVACVARCVRPGGIVAFQEYDSGVSLPSPEAYPLHARVKHWIWETLRRSGAEIHMGLKLYRAFADAGLRAIEMRAEAIVQTPSAHQEVASLVRTLLPKLLEYGVAREHEVAVDTLASRLAAERVAAGDAYVMQFLFGAWGRTRESNGASDGRSAPGPRTDIRR